MKKILSILALFICLVCFFGCTKTISPTSIILSQSSIEITEEESKTISATVLPEGAEYTLTWSSLDTSIATVNKGVIKAKSPGQVNILVSTENGISSVCSVIVKQKSAYDRLSKDEKDFVDMFLKSINEFKNPSSVTVESIVYHSDKSTWGLLGKWEVYVSAENGFGGHTSTLFNLTENGKITEALFQYSIKTLPVEMFNIDLINEAIKEKVK